MHLLLQFLPLSLLVGDFGNIKCRFAENIKKVSKKLLISYNIVVSIFVMR